MPTHAERIQTAVDTQEALTALFYTVLHGNSATSITTDNGLVPSVAKCMADIAAQIIGGYNAGYVQNVANTAGRTAAVPGAVGQLLLQRDTLSLYYATALTAGSWTIHPCMQGVQAATDVAALTAVVATKMAAATYDPGGFGFSRGNTDVQVFLADGAWTRPAGTLEQMEILLIAGGSGGGSGRRGAAASNRYGGGGGAGGAIVRVSFFPRAPVISGVFSEPSPWDVATLNVHIGAGGAGGAAVATDSTNGNAGTAGGSTYIADPGADNELNALAVAKSGTPGAGGTTTTGTAGSGTANSSVYRVGPASATGAGGAGGTSTPGTGDSSAGFPAPGGGGGGGGITSANAGNVSGATGGSPASFGVAFPSLVVNSTQPSLCFAGSGGTGGTSATNTSVHATAGAAGVIFGGGGGGGGAGINGGGSTGAGGAGAAGFCMIITQRVQ